MEFVRLILNWLINTAALFTAAKMLPGVQVAGVEALVVAALVIGLINATIRPVLRFVTFPLTLLTLGLFYFVLNGSLFYLAAAVIPGLELNGFGAAILGALVMSMVTTVLHLFVKPKKKTP